MADIPLKDVLLLWKKPDGDAPALFDIRPIGHDDYWNERWDYTGGACNDTWKNCAQKEHPALLARMFIDLWHIAAFYDVPIALIHEKMLVVPEYRAMLADDCLPKEFQHERA